MQTDVVDQGLQIFTNHVISIVNTHMTSSWNDEPEFTKQISTFSVSPFKHHETDEALAQQQLFIITFFRHVIEMCCCAVSCDLHFIWQGLLSNKVKASDNCCGSSYTNH